MRPDDSDRAAVPSPKRHEHRQERRSRPHAAKTKSPPHHPATRIGEIKHGKT